MFSKIAPYARRLHDYIAILDCWDKVHRHSVAMQRSSLNCYFDTKRTLIEFWVKIDIQCVAHLPHLLISKKFLDLYSLVVLTELGNKSHH